jgi:hypothetical protein
MNENSPAGIAFFVYVIIIVICSMEMVPGWGFGFLDWPESRYYIVAAITGAICGIFMASEARLAGMIGTPIGGVGALIATSLLLKHSTETHDGALAIVGLIGALPGLGVYALVKKIITTLGPEPAAPIAPVVPTTPPTPPARISEPE